MADVAAGHGQLTDADRERIEELAGRGWKAGRIAQVIKRHQSTVQWFMYTHALLAPKQTDTPKVYVRNGIKVQGFSRAEDAYIEELRKKGLDCIQIAAAATERFGGKRSHHTIRCRLKMLGSIEIEGAFD